MLVQAVYQAIFLIFIVLYHSFQCREIHGTHLFSSFFTLFSPPLLFISCLLLVSSDVRRSQVRKRTTDPKFFETFQFKVSTCVYSSFFSPILCMIII